ncbi:MAG: helix-turn-helix domain-containing protein [Bacteroidota bacterium]
MIWLEYMYLGGIALVLAAISILISKKDLSDAYKCLAVWMLFVALDFFHSLLNFFFFFSLPDLIIFPFAYGPLAYLYVKSLTERDFVFRLKVILHFLPLLLFLQVPLFWPDIITINAQDFWDLDDQTILGLINFCSFIILSVIYLVKVLRLIGKHRYRLGDEYSYRSSRITLNWLFITAILMLSSFVLTAVFALVFTLQEINPVDPVIFFQITMFIFSVIITWNGVRQPRIYGLPVLDGAEQEKTGKYTKTGLHPEEEHKLAVLLDELMQKEKLFLNGNLMLKDVAERLEIPGHYLSQVLSKQMKRNFFTYINEFRVEEAKRRIRGEEYRNHTLLSIAYDSGFNSKSSFNNIFLRIEGITPSEYRNQKQENI